MLAPDRLRVSELTVEFAARHRVPHGIAIRDLTFRVPRDRFVAIVGPSGCGKTTLLRTLAGIERASAGRIELDGHVVPHLGAQAAMVFQTPNLFPWRDVERNMAFGLEVRGADPAQIAQRVQELLVLTGLAAHAHKRPHELSGGMQQRVNLARGLAVKPAVLLMDEPFSALDAILRERLQMDLEAIWLHEPCLAVLVTHQLDEAIWLADDVLVMAGSPGRIAHRMEIGLPRPRRRDAATLARVASLQAELRAHLEDLGVYAVA